MSWNSFVISYQEVIIQGGETLSHLLKEDRAVPLSLYEQIFFMMQVVALLIAYFGGTLFCCLCWMASVMMRMLADDIRSQRRHHRRLQHCRFRTAHQSSCWTGQTDWTSMVDCWRRRYLLTAELVHQTSRNFGFVLLVLITSEFVRMTNTSFNLLTDFNGANWTTLTMLVMLDFFKEIVYLCILLYVPSRISYEVSLNHKLMLTQTTRSLIVLLHVHYYAKATSVIKQLRKVNLADHSLQSQVHVRRQHHSVIQLCNIRLEIT